MADNTTDKVLRAMADMPMTLSVGGEDFPIKRLGPGDLAAVQEFVASERKRRYLASVPLNEMMLPLHAKVLAELECEPVGIGILPSEPAGRMKLCYIALKKGGWQGDYEELKAKLDPIHAGEFFDKLLIVSGIYEIPKKEKCEQSDHGGETPDTT